MDAKVFRSATVWVMLPWVMMPIVEVLAEAMPLAP